MPDGPPHSALSCVTRCSRHGGSKLIFQTDDDFSLRKIADCGQCFRALGLGGNLWRFITGSHILHMRELGGGIFDADCSKVEWNSVWSDYFDLGTDYAAVRDRIPARDRYLTRCAAAGRGIRLLRQDPWEALVSFIISQRKTIPAIRRCIEALCETFGKEALRNGEIDSVSAQPEGAPQYFFPSAESLARASASALAACGLGYRVPYVAGAARSVADGALDLSACRRMDDDTLFATLMNLHGVGEKVANCVCLFGFHRTSRAPVDVWIRRVIDRNYHGKNPFRRYGADAGILQQYMFYHAVHEDGESLERGLCCLKNESQRKTAVTAENNEGIL